jgi:hypothetical protein
MTYSLGYVYKCKNNHYFYNSQIYFRIFVDALKDRSICYFNARKQLKSYIFGS